MNQSENGTPSSVEAEHVSNMARTDSKSDTPLTQVGSWDVHAKRQQLLALWKRYREADDYNRPAVKLLLRNVLRDFGEH